MNSPSFDYLGKRYTKFKKSYWMLLFHHDFTGNTLFESKEEAKNSSAPNKYSILYLLNDEYRTMKHNSLKYEFIINWPNLTTYYQWRQTKNPLDEEDIIGKFEVDGFEPIRVKENQTKFGGLAKDSNYSNTLLNGQLGHVYWCISVGMLTTSVIDWANRGIPASCAPASIVQLWVKTPFIASISNCRYQSNSRIYRLNFIMFLVFNS